MRSHILSGRLKSFVLQTRADNSPPPYLLKARSSKLFILSTICIAVFTDTFLYGIIVPVIPFALSSRAGVAESDVQKWVSVLLSVYGAALLVASPIAGYYADQTSSRRLPLLIGLLALGGSTVMLCLARTVSLLVVGRILQGFSGGVVWTVGQALIVDTVGQKNIGQALGYISISVSLGILVSPLLGGVVYNKSSYYAVFYLAFGVIILDIILRLAMIEKKIAIQWQEDGIDNSGGTNPEQTSDLAIEVAASSTPANLESDPEILSEPEKRVVQNNESKEAQKPAPSALLPSSPHSKWPPVLTLLTSKRVATALWGCAVQSSLLTSFDSVVPLFVARTFHWNSIGAGLVFLAIVIPSLASPLAGYVADRYGARWLTVTGFVIAVPFWLLLRLVTFDSLNQKVLFCALLSLIGVSLTLVLPPLMAEVSYIIEAKEKQHPGIYGPSGAFAQAYGLLIAAFAAGTLIGPIWSGYVEDSAGWKTMTLSLGLFSLAGALPCLIYTGGFITERNAKSGAERAVDQPPEIRRNDNSV